MSKSGRIIVVGGNAAGPAAAAKAKRVNPNAKVMLFEAGSYISTGTCEIPYVLSGDIKNYEDIVFYSPDSFLNKKGVQVFINHHVEQIDRRSKTITVRDLLTDKLIVHIYDSLILTTGSIPKTIPGFVQGLKNLFQLKNVSDLIGLKNFLNNNKIQNAIIIGSGYIGLEAAEALVKNKIEVTVIEKETVPMPTAEMEISEKALSELKHHLVRFIGGSNNLEPFIKNDEIVSIKCNDDLLDCDLVILTFGISPNNILAAGAKLDIGNFGGIKVDKKLKTTDRNIYAAGDNIEFTNAITGRLDYFPFATYAHTFGHIAGENAAGGNVNAGPIVKNVSVKIFGSYYASVGLNSSEAMKYNFKSESVSAKVPNLVKVMPESRSVFGKLIFDNESKLILGASFMGGSEVSGFADLIAAAIYSKQKIDFLTRISYNYTPPLSPFVNLLSVLGRKAVSKTRG